MTDELSRLLSARREDLQHRLRASLAPQSGARMENDVSILIDTLLGLPAEEYALAISASAQRAADDGSSLSERLTLLGLQIRALGATLADTLNDQPPVLAQAQERLAQIAIEAAAAMVRTYESIRDRQVQAEAEHARRGLTRLQALQRINAAANSTLDLDQTLNTTARAVAAEMNADACVIYLFDEMTRELQLRATSGPYPHSGRHYTLALGQGYTGSVAEHGRPLLVPDALADARFREEAMAYPQPFRAVLSVPIIFFTVEKLEGVITVQMEQPRAFTEEDANFLEIVAGQLAMSIENGRLYEQTDEELRRKVHELSTLHRVSALVASTLVLENVLTMIVGYAVQLSGADRSVLFELDPATQQLAAVASHGFDDPAVSRALLKIGQCCAGRVVQAGESRMHVDCMHNDERCFLHSMPAAIGDQHSALCVPLATRHGPLGALCVFSSQRHLLNNHQLQLVMTFANVAAIAMENARLFEQTREGLRTKEVLLREMHHRVKNNLQQVASILNMQRRRAKSPEIEQILVESVDRIQGIAATHDLLSNTQFGLAQIDEIARKIAGIVRGNLVPPHLRIQFRIGSAPIQVASEQATTLAIVLNELIANAIEHGFEGRTRGIIQISATRRDEQIVLRVADNGCGLPANFSIQSASGLGLQLVSGLVKSDLHGEVRIFQAPGNPDIGETNERFTDPVLPAISADDTATNPLLEPVKTEHLWTIVELTFPAVHASATESSEKRTALPSESLSERERATQF